VILYTILAVALIAAINAVILSIFGLCRSDEEGERDINRESDLTQHRQG